MGQKLRFRGRRRGGPEQVFLAGKERFNDLQDRLEQTEIIAGGFAACWGGLPDASAAESPLLRADPIPSKVTGKIRPAASPTSRTFPLAGRKRAGQEGTVQFGDEAAIPPGRRLRRVKTVFGQETVECFRSSRIPLPSIRKQSPFRSGPYPVAGPAFPGPASVIRPRRSTWRPQRRRAGSNHNHVPLFRRIRVGYSIFRSKNHPVPISSFSHGLKYPWPR